MRIDIINIEMIAFKSFLIMPLRIALTQFYPDRVLVHVGIKAKDGGDTGHAGRLGFYCCTQLLAEQHAIYCDAIAHQDLAAIDMSQLHFLLLHLFLSVAVLRLWHGQHNDSRLLSSSVPP